MRVGQVVNRICRASPREWTIRAHQFLTSRSSEFLAILGRSRFRENGHLLSLGIADTELENWFRDQDDHWFCNEERRQEISRAYDHNTSQRRGLIQRADAIVAGKMPLLGHGLIDYSGTDRWHRDPILDTVAPRRIYTRIRYLDTKQVGDSKHVWEPNRFGWAYWLGAASLVTGDDSYAQAFTELTLDWFERNPFPIGINYCSALEVAFRAYAWTWALDLFRTSLLSKPDLLDRLLFGIWLSCRHVEDNLSYYFSPNTHLLGEGFSLYACGAAIPEFAEAKRWRDKGEAILTQEAGRQLHRDGTHRELSSCYHLYTTDFYVQASLIAERTGFTLNHRVSAAAIKLANRLAEITPQTGLLPQFNDCDGGRLTWFCNEPLDALPSLAAARKLPGNSHALPEDSRAACGYNLWMGASGTPSVQTSNAGEPSRPDCPGSAGQYDSGIVTYRDDSGDYLLFRSGPFGYMDCGHSHDAPTGFILYLAGHEVIVDSGVGHYTQNLDIRNSYRAGQGQNILLVDGSGPSRPGDWFSWKRKTDATLSCARQLEHGFFCAGSHEGFTRLAGFPILVERAITLFDEGVVVVVDRWKAEQEISPTALLTLHPEVSAESARQLSLPADGPPIHYLAEQFDPTTPGAGRKLDVAVEQVDYSPNYGATTKTSALAYACAPLRSGSSVMVLSRSGLLASSEEAGEFLLDRPDVSATIRVDFEAKTPASLTICPTQSLDRQPT